jgi:hypothetical protein
MKISAIVSTAVLALFLSCAAAPAPQTGDSGSAAAPSQTGEAASFEAVPAAPLLPLAEGWYLYDFERTFKGIEDEYQFALSTGMTMVEEITLKQTGTVTYCSAGILRDPVLEVELLVDKAGNIRSEENPSIAGALSANGDFYWTGLMAQLGRTNHISVRGKLTFLPRIARAGDEYSGLYHLVDSGTERGQLVRIEDGFYTWRYTDEKAADFTPWPTRILPDGSFSFSMETITVLAMGTISQANYSTGFSTEGRVSPGGISIQEVSHTAGAGTVPSDSAPQIYAGTAIRDGQFPNEEIPKNAAALLRPGAAAAPKKPIDWARYPAWYRRPPVKAGFIYATGEYSFQDRETSFALAEAAAAASIAAQIRARVSGSSTETANNAGTSFESRVESEALENIPYRVAERHYREDGTAFVLLELELSALK